MQYFESFLFDKESQVRVRDIEPHITNPRDATAALQTCFSEAVTRASQKTEAGRVGILLSGGVDSSLLLAYLNQRFSPAAVDCLTVYTDTRDGDVRPSEEVSRHFGNHLVRCKITSTFLDTHFADAASLPNSGLYVMAANLALIRALEACQSRGITELWVGNGIDMMFGGGVDPKQFAPRRRDAKAFHEAFWQQSMQLLVQRFYHLGYPEMDMLARRYRVRLVLPFANLETIYCARSIWAPLLFKGRHDKYPVRLLARQMGVPKREAFRKKRPLQESSGIFAMLQQHMIRELPALLHDGISAPFDAAMLQHDRLLALRLYVALKRESAKHSQPH